MDRGAWQVTIHGVAESDSTERLSLFFFAMKTPGKPIIQWHGIKKRIKKTINQKFVLKNTKWKVYVTLRNAYYENLYNLLVSTTKIFTALLRYNRYTVKYTCVHIPQVCLTLRDPMDYSPPGCNVHGILQAREDPFSKGSSQPRDTTPISNVSCVGRGVLYHESHLGTVLKCTVR